MAIAAVVAGIALLVLHWDKVKAAFSSFNDWLDAHPVFDFILRAVFPVLGVIRLVRRHWDSLLAFFKFTLSWSPIGLVIRFWEPIKWFFAGIWDGIKTGLVAAWEALKAVFSWSPLGIIIRIYGAVFKYLENKFGIFTKIGSAIKGVGRFLGFGKDGEKDAGKDGARETLPAPARRQETLLVESREIKAAAARAAAAPVVSRVDVGGITINAAPGQSEKEIVRAAVDELEERQQAAVEAIMTDYAHA
jgi:hypothetical protein